MNYEKNTYHINTDNKISLFINHSNLYSNLLRFSLKINKVNKYLYQINFNIKIYFICYIYE